MSMPPILSKVLGRGLLRHIDLDPEIAELAVIDGGGRAHSKVLFNCLEAMGITDTSGLGDDSTDREPLAELRA